MTPHDGTTAIPHKRPVVVGMQRPPIERLPRAWSPIDPRPRVIRLPYCPTARLPYCPTATGDE